MSFENKTVIVTGAAGNLGRAVAKAFGDLSANLVLVDLKRERLEGADFHQVAGPSLAGRLGTQPFQQPQRRLGGLGGEQHPGQHQVLALAGVAGLVGGGEAAGPDPAGGGVDLALGEGQAGPLGWDRVDQADQAG